MNEVKPMSSADVADLFGGYYDVWVGSLGYDTRPYVKRRTAGWERDVRLPVAFNWASAYYASDASDASDASEAFPEGDIGGFIAALPVGAIIVSPEYSGCNYHGEEAYILKPEGWELAWRRGWDD